MPNSADTGQRKTTSGLAIICLVLSVIGIILLPVVVAGILFGNIDTGKFVKYGFRDLAELFFPPFLLFILGIISLGKIRNSDGRFVGTGIAVTGIVLGSLIIIVLITTLMLHYHYVK